MYKFMNWIEFIAPSGTGKTTLLINVKKLSRERNWVTGQEAISEIIRNKKSAKVKECLVKLYLRQNIIHFQKNNVEFGLLEMKKAY